MKQDESYLIPFLSEKAEQCLSNQMITNSAFLDLHEKSQAAGLRLPHGVRRIFYGGFEGAERTAAVFLPDYIEAEDFASLSEFFILSPDDCPVAVLEVEKDGDTKSVSETRAVPYSAVGEGKVTVVSGTTVNKTITNIITTVRIKKTAK